MLKWNSKIKSILMALLVTITSAGAQEAGFAYEKTYDEKTSATILSRSFDEPASDSSSLWAGKAKDTLDVSRIAKDSLITRNYPNPFNSSTIITYTLQEEARVLLKIYNSLGREVRTLIDETEKAGLRAVTWDGRNNQGRPLSSGTYYYRLKTGKSNESGKMIMMK